MKQPKTPAEIIDSLAKTMPLRQVREVARQNQNAYRGISASAGFKRWTAVIAEIDSRLEGFA